MSIKKNHAIIASAGTGKTEQLALRYIALLKHSSPDTTLAVTFTKNAAGEILDRIINLLLKGYNTETGRKRLKESLGENLSKEDIKKFLITIIDKLPRLSISTIDSFFYQVIACYPLELGLSSAPDISQGFVNKQIQKRVLKNFFSLSKRDKKSLELFINIIQNITKNRESQKISKIIEDNINALYNIYLNSTEEAWKGIKVSRIPELSWEKIIKNYEKLVENKNDNDNAKKFLTKLKNKNYIEIFSSGPVVKYLNNQTYRGLDLEDPNVKNILQDISDYAFNEIIKDENKKTAALYEFIKLYDKIFNKIKAQENVINFDDIYRMLIGSISVKQEENGLHIYYRLDSKINNFLIDEFQDTSRNQWLALQPLATEVIQDTDFLRTYFMVGDLKQSIYGWRGGDPRLFLKICRKYNITPSPLAKSYRTGKEILSAINDIFLSDRAKQWAENVKFTKHESAVNFDSYFELFCVGNEYSIEQYIFDLIDKIKPQKRNLSFAILYRTTKGVNNMADFLRSKGISCSILGTGPLFQKPIVRRLLSLFELIDNPSNRIAHFHLTESNSYLKNLIPKEKRELHLFLKKLRSKLIKNSYASVISNILKSISKEKIDSANLRYLDQLVELSEQYEPLKTTSPIDFVNFVEQTDISSPKTTSDIILSTIHGSKGLGFDIVVLPELNKKGINQRFYIKKNKNVNISNDEPEINLITTLSKKQLTLANEIYKKVREEYDENFRFELMNLLYVALTRARRALYLVVKDTKVTKNGDVKLMTDVILPAFDCTDEAKNIPKVLKNYGEKNWFNNIPEIKKLPKQTTSKIKEIKLNEKSKRYRQYQTPTSLYQEKFYTFSRKIYIARQKGIIIHALFKQITWLNDFQVDKIDLLQIARLTAPNLTDELYENVINQFLDMLEKPAIKNLLTKPLEDCEVKNELSFAAIVDNKLTRGIFDRVVFFPNAETPQKIHIYDYKTDFILSEKEIDALINKYSPQINCYVDVLTQTINLDKEKIKAKLVFTNKDIIKCLP